MENARSIKPIALRLEDELKIWLKHRAVDTHRSVNGELVAILSRLKEAEGTGRQAQGVGQ